MCFSAWLNPQALLNLKSLLNKFAELDNIENYTYSDLLELRENYLSGIEFDAELGYKDPKFKDVYFKIE